MARGVRKTYEEKLMGLEQEIEGLEKKLKALQEQRKELQKKQQEEQLQKLCGVMEEKGLTTAAVIEMLKS